MNPGFSRPLIRAAVTPRIVLPADKVDVFHDNLAKHNPKALVSWKSYQPRKGDSFESIARKHGMAVAQLKEVNGIAPRSKAVPRLLVVPTNPVAAAKLPIMRALPSLLVVPTGSAASASTRLPIMYAPPIPVRVRRIFHTVKAGETLASIARRYGVAAEDVKRWNPGVRATPGRRVAVELSSTRLAKAKPRTGKKKRAKAA